MGLLLALHLGKLPANDLLRVHHEKIEAWILEQAGIVFDAKAAPGALRVVAGQYVLRFHYGNSHLHRHARPGAVDAMLEALKDIRARAQIRARLARLGAGNFGDCKPLRDGVQELKIDYGPGYRVYLSRQGPVLVLLLCGSDKGDQDRAIKQSIDYLNDWKQRGKP